MPQKNQTQNSSTRLTTGGFANIVVLVIFLLTMGGAVVYFKNFPLEKLPAGETQVKDAVKNTTASSSSQENPETSLWQTYKNEKYHYEIKYPQGTLFNESKPNKSGIESVGIGGFIMETAKIIEYPLRFPQQDFLAQDFQQVVDYVEKEFSGGGNKISKTTFNGYNAVSFVPYDADTDVPSIFVFHKPNIIVIRSYFEDDSKMQEYAKNDKKILATFKFTE